MSTDYIHGYSAREQARLTLMQTLLNEAELAQIDLGGSPPVRRLLDVGCGLGQLTRAFARALPPDATVIGVERDERQLAEARRQAEADGEAELVELRAGDATALPLADSERGSFDLVHTRFLLEHVVDPLAVVLEMVAAARPGGRVVLIDDDHELLRLWPECTLFEWVWRIYWQSYRERGFDPLVGRRLPELLLAAGAVPTRVTGVFFGAVSGSTAFDGVIDNLAAIITGATDALAASGRLTAGQQARALDDLDRWRREPAATLWYTLPLAEGVRPGTGR